MFLLSNRTCIDSEMVKFISKLCTRVTEIMSNAADAVNDTSLVITLPHKFHYQT